MKIVAIDNLKLNNKKILLIGLVVLFVIYIDCAFLIKMQANNLRVLRPRVAELKKDIAAFENDLASISSLKYRPGQPGFVGKQIISEDDLPDLLEYISDVANQNNIRLMQIKSSRETKAKQERGIVAAKFLPLYISLDIFSSYHNLGAFINVLENSDQFIAVQDMKIARAKDDYLRQEASLTLKTYVRK
jgi:Tfp pilus assembly protein PilO